MDDDVLTKGRYKNKTYKYVLENDTDYCKSIRQAAEKRQRHPSDEAFGRYLVEKNQVLREQGSAHFVKRMSTAMRKEFHDLVANVEITEKRKVHPECKLGWTNGFLGIFYRYFIKKCVFNIRDEDGYNTYVDKYATIFPFEVSFEVFNRDRIPILKVLHADKKFRKVTRDFLNAHFDDVQFDDVVDSFLSNIVRFQQESGLDLRHMKSVSMNGGAPRLIDGSGDRFGIFRQAKPHPYLKNFPRLNEKGASRYIHMYGCYEDIMHFHVDPNAHSKYTTSYFTNLPETNFYELFSLLECDFFQKNFETYAERFHKYLFFFVGASRSVPNPVFFIDDYLFECLKSLHRFKKSRLPASKIIHELRMITLVHRRKQACDRPRGQYYEVDPRHLEHIQNYIENFRRIETAKIEYEIPDPDLLQCNALLCLDDTTIDVRFSKESHGAKSEFWESFLMAALCDFPVIKRLVLYNAFFGTEFTVKLDETFDREGIRTFVRKYNNWDFSTVIPFERSLTWGWEDCFVDGTVDYDEKTKNSMIRKK